MVEYACNLAPDLMGDYIENVSTGMDTYSIRQPLGVGRPHPCTQPALTTPLLSCKHAALTTAAHLQTPVPLWHTLAAAAGCWRRAAAYLEETVEGLFWIFRL